MICVKCGERFIALTHKHDKCDECCLVEKNIRHKLNGMYAKKAWKAGKKGKNKRRGKRKRKAIKNFYASKEWRALRYQALKIYGRRCLCCGATPESGAILHVDHIKPRSRYPNLALDINNLQILCEDCNLGKSATDSIDYRPDNAFEEGISEELDAKHLAELKEKGLIH